MSNPLLDKYFELYPEKKEEPKKVEYEVDPTAVSVDEYLKYTKPYLSSPNIPLTTSPTVVNPNSPITPAPKPYVSHDYVSGNNALLEVASKIQNDRARVSSVSVERDILNKYSRVVFEVYVDDY